MRVCTNGALEMLELLSGFVARIKHRSLNAVGTHCNIPRKALVSKILSPTMNDKLAIVICVVNFVKKSCQIKAFYHSVQAYGC